MSTYVVAVTLRAKDTHRTVDTWVSVDAPYDEPNTALLLACQLTSSHRESFDAIGAKIVEMEA
jgi:hypothetical protein